MDNATIDEAKITNSQDRGLWGPVIPHQAPTNWNTHFQPCASMINPWRDLKREKKKINPLSKVQWQPGTRSRFNSFWCPIYLQWKVSEKNLLNCSAWHEWIRMDASNLCVSSRIYVTTRNYHPASDTYIHTWTITIDDVHLITWSFGLFLATACTSVHGWSGLHSGLLRHRIKKVCGPPRLLQARLVAYNVVNVQYDRCADAVSIGSSVTAYQGMHA